MKKQLIYLGIASVFCFGFTSSNHLISLDQNYNSKKAFSEPQHPF